MLPIAFLAAIGILGPVGAVLGVILAFWSLSASRGRVIQVALGGALLAGIAASGIGLIQKSSSVTAMISMGATTGATCGLLLSWLVPQNSDARGANTAPS